MTNTTETFHRFAPGQIVATPGALALLTQHGVSPNTILRRHLAGDWGTLCSDDAALNDEALRDGSRILSSYLIAPGVTVWIITDAEADIDDGLAVTVDLHIADAVVVDELSDNATQLVQADPAAAGSAQVHHVTGGERTLPTGNGDQQAAVGVHAVRPALDELVRAAAECGYESIWTSEAYGSDALTPLTWQGALNPGLRLGTAVMQMSARTPTATAMAATVSTSRPVSSTRIRVLPSGPV